MKMNGEVLWDGLYPGGRKKCPHCGEMKSVEMFDLMKNEYRQSWCKRCRCEKYYTRKEKTCKICGVRKKREEFGNKHSCKVCLEGRALKKRGSVKVQKSKKSTLLSKVPREVRMSGIQCLLCLGLMSGVVDERVIQTPEMDEGHTLTMVWK